MKISAAGAGVGALVGCIARAAVVLLNLGPSADKLAIIALPSAGIGLLVGAIAGAFARPFLGAAAGAILSGVVFELFMFACASLIGSISHEAGAQFFSQTLLYGLEIALAGAVAGAVGGWVGRTAAAKDRPGAPKAHGAGGSFRWSGRDVKEVDDFDFER
jgi:hypothetical protein